MRMFSSKALIKAVLLVFLPTKSAIMLAPSPKDFNGLRHNFRGTPRERVECLQRPTIRYPSCGRLALAASGACRTLDWHA
jgi:hypothetical protein